LSCVLKAIKQRITSSEYECKSNKVKLESDIQDKRRQLEILNDRISSLNDPKGIETTIKKCDDEYEQLKNRQRKEETENLAKMKAASDEIRHACMLVKENEAQKKQLFNDMNDYISQKMEECESFKLLES
jgi:phosphotransacetylase